MKLDNTENTNTQSQEKLLTRKEAALFLGVKPSTLEAWATNKRYNLPMIKLGKRMVKYKLSDLIEFLEKRRVEYPMAD
ncbi:MAG: helix-turn-helix transcriptional regulator [Alphaproteobacteria bacterium]